jgi:hypothetical protein
VDSLASGQRFGWPFDGAEARNLDASIIPPADPRWERLRFQQRSGVDVRDRFRGTLTGGANGDAMGRPRDDRSIRMVERTRARETYHA